MGIGSAGDDRGDPAVEYRRSTWAIELGPLRIARHRSVRRVVGAGPSHPARRIGGGAIGAARLVALAIAAPVYLTQAKVLTAAPYVVSQPVPDRPAPSARAHASRPTRSRPSLPSARAEPAAFVAPADAAEPGAGTSADRAATVAWRTGEPQDWSDDGAHGIVVPGAIERGDGFVCRTLARLTRRDGQPDAVEQSHRCSAIAADRKPG